NELLNNRMKRIIYLLAAICFVGCRSQTELIRHQKEKPVVERFNFDFPNKRNQYHSTKYTIDSTWTISIEREDGIDVFCVKEEAIYSKFTTYKYYSRDSLYLMKKTVQFYNHDLSTTQYDSEGNVIEEIDWLKTEGYTFPLDALIKKIKKKYDIDLTYKYALWNKLDLQYCDKIPVYKFTLYFADLFNKQFVTLVIDGRSGKVLFFHRGSESPDLNAKKMSKITRK
ncbi:hypothetical protein LJC68_03885, partial [Bacteroidales bacterium OttesenSCG-928-B11]|nr:hypothetical protein [Bacteroidales bacterium OttesenSCG-928-E04]MDL2311999.1 hypothetical protein [Bacteroidales bacterium OttesenSCG-928-B11]